jgi:hypothetical protein
MTNIQSLINKNIIKQNIGIISIINILGIISIVCIVSIIIFMYIRYNVKADIFDDITTTTDPVISYEHVIPTNPKQDSPSINKNINLFSFVEPNKTPPGMYNDSKLDLLVTNGLFTIGSNWVYDAVFAV